MTFNREGKSLLWGNLYVGMGTAAQFPVLCQSSPPTCVQHSSALLHVGLGFPGSFVPLLGCEPLKWGVPRLWVSSGLFRQRGWRVVGSCWVMRVCLLSPRGGIAGGPPRSSLPAGSSVPPPPALGPFRYVSWAFVVWGICRIFCCMWLLS